MSCFDVKILDPDINTIEIETCIGDQPSSINIVTYDNTSLVEVNHCIALLPSEINDLIVVKDIVAGSGISVADSSGIYTISLSDPTIYTNDIVDFLEGVQDVIGQSGLVAGNYTLINYDDNTGITTVSVTGLQPSGNYSVVGHTHLSSNITDFDSAVSGLLPVKNISAGSGIGITSVSGDFTVSVTGTFGLTSEEVDDRVNNLLVAGNYVNLNYNDLGNTLTVSVTGLQPSGNYSTVGHSHVIADVSGLQNALDGKQPSGNYSLVGHNHSASDITNFASEVSGLLPIINGSGYILSSFINNTYIISVSGLQPSGNYSVVGHNHSSSDITDFNGAVSGLIPPSNFTSLSGINGIDVSNSGTDYTVSLASSGNFDNLTVSGVHVSVSGHTHVYTDITNFASGVDAALSTSLIAGTGIYLYEDTLADTLSINVTGVSMVGHTHTSSNITDFDSSVSGLLPSVTGTGYIESSFSNNIYTIGVTGLQPSGNYSVVGHTHLSTDITDFGSAVSGLLPVKNILGSGYINVASSGGIYTISATGLQASGNYSLVGHTHTTSDITNFNSGVSGLLPSFTGTSGVTVSYAGNNYTISLNDPTIQLADITDLSTNAQTFLLTPSSNNLSTLVNDETGSGILVFNNSPAFSGTPTVPTAPSGTNTTQIASTAFVRTEISNLIDSAPSTLDTLNELAAALGDDPNFATTITNTLAGKANLSGAIFTGPVTIPSGTGNFNSLTVNGTNVSVSGHTHTSSNITDFNSSVSGLLPVKDILGGTYISVGSSSGVYTISATGLQPSGNYSVVGHTHTSSEITDFNSSVSGLLPSVTGTGYVTSSFAGNIYTIGVTGLQPSGNYSLVGHTHSSSDITDFNSAVSGLIPVKNILSGTGISISNASGIYTIEATGSGVLSDQAKSLVTTVFNKTGSPIPKMTAVYINGGQGDMPTINLAIATADMTSAGTYGLTYEAIPNMESGLVIVFGALTGLDTDQFNPTAPTGNVNGSVLYLSPSVSGALTLTKPSAPNHIVAIGTIVRTHQNEGVIEVRVQNGFELEELHNVAISGVTNGQFLQYNSTSGLWIPTSSGNFTNLQVSGTPVSVSGHTHSSSDITNFNSAVSGLVSGIYQPLLSNPVTGTGIVNHVAYWNSSSGIAASSGQLVWDSSNNRLGIGISNPSGSLHVDNGDIYLDNSKRLYIVASGQSKTSNYITSPSNGNLQITANGPSLVLSSQGGWVDLGWTASTYINIGQNYNAGTNNQNIRFSPAGTERVRITSDGLLGIGFTAPSGKLGVNGGVTVGANYNLNPPLNGAIIEGTVGVGINNPSGVVNIVNTVQHDCAPLNISTTGGALNTRTHIGIGNSDTTPFLASLAGGLTGSIYGWGFFDRGTDGDFQIRRKGGSNSWSDVLHITRAAGNVGIGTTSPAAALHVVGTSGIRVGSSSANSYIYGPSGNAHIHLNQGTNNILLNSNTYAGSSVSINTQSTNLNSSATYVNGTLAFPKGGTATSTATQRNPNAIYLYSSLWNGSSAYDGLTSIETIVSTTVNQQSRLAFLVNNGDGTINRTERLSISSSGYIGVNKTTPRVALDVVGSGLFASTTGLTANALLDVYSNVSGAMVFNVEGTNGSLFSVIDSMSGSLMSVNNNAGLPVFEVFSDDRIVGGRFNQNDFVVTGSGNIGIGTAAPSGKLHVLGTIFTSGLNLTSSQTIASSGASGIAGTITYDANYLYVCVATNSWKRIAYDAW